MPFLLMEVSGYAGFVLVRHVLTVLFFVGRA